MEDSLSVESMRRFAGVDLESVPDDHILKFRHFLEQLG